MVSKTIMGGGTVLVAILLVLTTLLNWPSSLNYVWAVLVLIWGIMSFTG